MTRDILRPLEGQLVTFTGRLASVTRQGDAHDHLVSAVRCWRWDGTSAIEHNAAPAARLDHVWLRLPAAGAPRMELLKPVRGIAKVRWYRRGDGSVDLGLVCQPCLDLDIALAELRESLRHGEHRTTVIQAIGSLLREIQKPRHHAYSRAVSTAVACRRLQAMRDELERSQAAEIRIRATSPRGRRPSGVGSFADLLGARVA